METHINMKCLCAKFKKRHGMLKDPGTCLGGTGSLPCKPGCTCKRHDREECKPGCTCKRHGNDTVQCGKCKFGWTHRDHATGCPRTGQ